MFFTIISIGKKIMFYNPVYSLLRFRLARTPPTAMLRLRRLRAHASTWSSECFARYIHHSSVVRLTGDDKSSGPGLDMRAVSAAETLKRDMRFSYDLVRRLDYAGYMPTAHMSHGMRTPSIVMRALNIELQQTGKHAKTAPLLAIRQQWWRDGIAAALKAERVPDQPILRSLQQLHLHQPLSKYRVTRFVEARLAELAPDAPPPATLAALEAQSEAADSNLLYLIAEGCGMSSSNLDHCLSHLGKATGLAGVLAGVLPDLAAGRLRLPHALCTERGVSLERLRDGTCDMDAFQDVVFEVAKAARGHLEEVLRLQGALGPKEKLLVLYALHPSMVLKRLEDLNFNALDSSMLRGLQGVNPLSFQVKLLWAALTGKVRPV